MMSLGEILFFILPTNLPFNLYNHRNKLHRCTIKNINELLVKKNFLLLQLYSSEAAASNYVCSYFILQVTP